MDFDKIRLQALQEAEEQAVAEIFSHINLSNKELFTPAEVDIVDTLQRFASHISSETVKLYHAELQKKLAKKGIEI